MIPYGYRIVNGKAELDEECAEGVRRLFTLYLDGWSIQACAEKIGITLEVAKKALSNRLYLGTDFYPAIIDQETFKNTQVVRAKRNRRKSNESKFRIEALPVRHKFRINPVIFNRKPDQADPIGYLYKNIEAGEDEQFYKTHMAKTESEKLKQLLWPV